MTNQKPIQALIYDLDGTLVDSRRDLYAAAHAMLTHFGLAPKTEEEVQGYIGLGVRHLVNRTLDGHEELLEEGFRVFCDYYHRHLTDFTTLYQGVTEVLEHFRHKKQFVLTNKLDTEARMIVQQLGIARYFTEVIGDAGGMPLKPDPSRLLAILDTYGLGRQEAVMVGDSCIDVETGQKAGVTTVFLSSGFGRKGTIRPDITADRFTDLMDYFI
ncbi:MAG: HAD-IA family hydrolase [bacterium]